MNLAAENLKDAKHMFSGGRFNFCGYCCRMAVREALNAFYVNTTDEYPLKVSVLKDFAALVLDADNKPEYALWMDMLDKLYARQEDGDELDFEFTKELCAETLRRTGEFLYWSKQKLNQRREKLKLNEIGFRAKLKSTGKKLTFTFDNLYGYEGEIDGVFLDIDQYTAIRINDRDRRHQSGINADMEILAIEVNGVEVWPYGNGQ
jgi:HEPN domain-containing protein